MTPFDFQLRTRLIFGPGTLDRVGALAGEPGVGRVLVVADPGLGETGHVERTVAALDQAGVHTELFTGFAPNPDTHMVAAGAEVARAYAPDALLGLGGGSALDCAKGINFLLTNGGTMADYRGYDRARRPLLPMLAVPTTAGTGSEAQSYAVIADAETHMKMACGAPGAAFRIAVLDPELTCTQPREVTAASGYDAIAHAVETAVTKGRTSLSELFTREAFSLLDASFERVLDDPDDVDARGAMQLGAFYAGTAIEQSMLGAAHACANPLTARHDLIHGHALAILLPHVVRWNAVAVGAVYQQFVTDTMRGTAGDDRGDLLATRLTEIGRRAGLPERLRDTGVTEADLASLAEAAGEQWTGTFNPRPFGAPEALEVYRCAY